MSGSKSFNTTSLFSCSTKPGWNILEYVELSECYQHETLLLSPVKVWRAGTEDQSVHGELSTLRHQDGVREPSLPPHQVQLQPGLARVRGLDDLRRLSGDWRRHRHRCHSDVVVAQDLRVPISQSCLLCQLSLRAPSGDHISASDRFTLPTQLLDLIQQIWFGYLLLALLDGPFMFIFFPTADRTAQNCN